MRHRPRTARFRSPRWFSIPAAALCLFLAALCPPIAQASDQDSLTLTVTPRDVWPPGPITDLRATPGLEGQVLLEWTAPDSNGDLFSARTPAAGYDIRIATFSVDSVGGSTAAWWSSAIDVRVLPPPALGGAPPAPSMPGAQDTMLLSLLEPGATFYAMIVSTDSAGFSSDADAKALTPGGQAFALVYDALPPSPSGLAVTQAGASTFTVSWSALSIYDLDYYKLYIDKTAPYDFTDAVVSTAPRISTQTMLVDMLPGLYAFRVAAVDKGAPGNLGLPLESPPSATVMAAIILRLPQTPYGIELSTGGGLVTIRWLPVVRFGDLEPFVDPSVPSSAELTSYHVLRSSTVALGAWTELASLSTAAYTWTGVDVETAPYYTVRSGNNYSEQSMSARSLIRSAATLEGFIVAPDDQSYFRIPAAQLAPLIGTAGDPASAYAVSVASRPQDMGGRVYQSLDFQAYRGGKTLDAGFALGDLGTLYLHYEIAGSSLTPEFAGVAADPQNASVYWWNGVRWLQLYGQHDTLAGDLYLRTRYLGRYQIRSVERVTSFAFNLSGLSNRFVTPNGDGKNDAVVFTFDNPQGAKIIGRILDLRGHVVVSNLMPGPVENSLQWDGKAGGRGVPGGVYIYQLEGDGQSFTGTIVILK